MVGDPRVLVVDDDETSRLMLTYRLELVGMQTLSAGNGREALELLNKGAVDLVLLDILMPEMGGYEALGKIMADPNLRSIPVMMISALGDMETVVKCLEIGAADYLPKPLDALLLVSRVKNILLSRKLDELERDIEAHVSLLSRLEAGSVLNDADLESLREAVKGAEVLKEQAKAMQAMSLKD